MLSLSADKPSSAVAYSPVFEVLSKPAVTLSESDLISAEMLSLSADKPSRAVAYSPVFEVLSKPAVTLSESDLMSSESELLNALISPACLLFSDMPFSISSAICLSLSEERLSLSVIEPSISSV